MKPNSFITRAKTSVKADMNVKDATKFVIGVFKGFGIDLSVSKSAAGAESNALTMVLAFKHPVTKKKETFSLSLNGKSLEFDGMGSSAFNPDMAQFEDIPSAPDFVNIKKTKTIKDFDKWSVALGEHHAYVEDCLSKMASFAEDFFMGMKELNSAVQQNKLAK